LVFEKAWTISFKSIGQLGVDWVAENRQKAIGLRIALAAVLIVDTMPVKFDGYDMPRNKMSHSIVQAI